MCEIYPVVCILHIEWLVKPEFLVVDPDHFLDLPDTHPSLGSQFVEPAFDRIRWPEARDHEIDRRSREDDQAEDPEAPKQEAYCHVVPPRTRQARNVAIDPYAGKTHHTLDFARTYA